MRALLIVIAGLLPLPAGAQAPPAATPADDPSPDASQAMGTLVLTAAPGIEVRVDDAVIGQTPLPGPWTLSPGDHTVELRPASGSPTVRRITVAAGQQVALDLGGAIPTPAATVEAPEVPADVLADPLPPVGPGFSLATAGYVAAGLGVLGVGAGVGLGVLADGYATEASDLDRSRNDRADQQALVDQADSTAFWSNVSYGAGGVLLIGGAAMILLATDGPLGVAPAPGGAMVEGRF